MTLAPERLQALIAGMRAAYARGENAMTYARDVLDQSENDPLATLISYDLQAGSYVEEAVRNPESVQRWCRQLADGIAGFLNSNAAARAGAASILEVGCGEATTLAGVVGALGSRIRSAYGFDLSWSRVMHGRQWLQTQAALAELFVADLFHIPMADASVDVVYSSHSLEPNRGREEAAIRECLRVARYGVLLAEPIYELADEPARRRIDEHGYVRGLKQAAEAVGAEIVNYGLLEWRPDAFNPSGALLLAKPRDAQNQPAPQSLWICPLTGAALQDFGDVWYAADSGIAYPVFRGVPMLRPEHAILAARFGELYFEG